MFPHVKQAQEDKAYASAVTGEEIWRLIQDGGRRTYACACACAYITLVPTCEISTRNGKCFFFLGLCLCLTHAYSMLLPHDFSYAYACAYSHKWKPLALHVSSSATLTSFLSIHL